MSGAADEGPAGDKPHEPTQKRLEDARRKGEIPRSTDLTTAAAYGGFCLMLLFWGGVSVLSLATWMQGFLSNAGLISERLLASGGSHFGRGFITGVAQYLLPWFLLPAALAVISLWIQRAILFTPSKLVPKLSRISPLSNAQQKFGRSGLFEFTKSAAKLSVYSALLAALIYARMPELLAVHMASLPQALGLLGQLIRELAGLIFVIALCIGGLDLLWQRADHQRRNRMSRKDLRDEQKQAEGDPEAKQKRRQRGQELALSQLIAQVGGADVVIVNPTHFAVALKWSRQSQGAPVCVAKGVDEIALRIREEAARQAVPVHHDPPTARALHATVEIGDEVPPDHYRAVAAAIRFAEAMRHKAGAWR
ncbi:flagellar biosynthesis protein FlhB [Pelagovum sp. HNIBRBA483]|uniref:EscU/YscU/HrcU family type III secretion system export apparatus switch protein n=1 Tax=Pelagovum sp. HNIBRBA483 TaxID=3233341 RepID=UPI0034A1008F